MFRKKKKNEKKREERKSERKVCAALYAAEENWILGSSDDGQYTGCNYRKYASSLIT